MEMEPVKKATPKCGKRGYICNEDCELCYSRSVASCPRAAQWSAKNTTPARMVLKGSDKVFILDCECGHEVTMPANQITRGTNCTYCSTNGTKKLCNADCAKCYAGSFASHEKARFWSPENDVTAREVFLGSKKKYIFNCECGHVIQKRPTDVVSLHWCPYCCERGGDKKLCTDKNCMSCFNNSLASHPKEKFWNLEKNIVRPREVFKASSKKYWFSCECGHDIHVRISHINSGIWCAYCASFTSKLCDKDDCDHCFKRSFASHEKSKYWSPKNELKPRSVILNSNKEYYFVCERGHEIKLTASTVARSGWCGQCKNKTEVKLHEFLCARFETKIHPRFEWCKNPDSGKYLPLDFLVEALKIVVELDGDQHFRQISDWDPPDVQFAKDVFKQDRVLSNGYSVIRIYQKDVIHDKNDWQTKLLDAIKAYETPTIVYISSGDQYGRMIEHYEGKV